MADQNLQKYQNNNKDYQSSEVEQRLDEATLVKHAQEGEQRAFEELYRYYYHRICLYLTHMVGDEVIGSELTQDTFVKVWTALPRIQEPTRFRAWLYATARNVAVDYMRRERRYFSPNSNATREAIEASVEGPELEIEAKEILRQALARVSPAYRLCLILYHMQGFSQREVALVLGIKEGSVSKYIKRGITQLRHALLQERQETGNK